MSQTVLETSHEDVRDCVLAVALRACLRLIEFAEGVDGDNPSADPSDYKAALRLARRATELSGRMQ